MGERVEIETLAKIIIQARRPAEGEPALVGLNLKMAALMMHAGPSLIRVRQARGISVVAQAWMEEATSYSSNPSLHIHPLSGGS